MKRTRSTCANGATTKARSTRQTAREGGGMKGEIVERQAFRGKLWKVFWDGTTYARNVGTLTSPSKEHGPERY